MTSQTLPKLNRRPMTSRGSIWEYYVKFDGSLRCEMSALDCKYVSVIQAAEHADCQHVKLSQRTSNDVQVSRMGPLGQTCCWEAHCGHVAVVQSALK